MYVRVIVGNYVFANMVKWTKKTFQCTKTISFRVKPLKVVVKCYFKLEKNHGALYCCVKYSNIEYQDEIFKNYH
jgi:hypothetical protein